MKLQILQENLIKSLSLASKFTSVKAQLPVLNNILLSASANKLVISSTNLENSVSTSVAAKVEEDGIITIPAKVITEFISNLPKGSVSLETEKENLLISSDKFSSSIAGMNASDFPEIISKIDQAKSFKIPKEALLKGVSKVLISTSSDETRPVLTGILFIFSKSEITLVTTDGFRLTRYKIEASLKDEEKRVVLPKFVLGELARIDEGESVYIDYNKEENQVLFGLENTVITSRLLDGEFPNFERIIPKESSIKVTLDKDELGRAVKLAGVFARDSSNVSTLKIEDSSLSILAESRVYGSQSAKVDAKIESKEKLNNFLISLNYHYMEEALNSISGDEVCMGFSDANSPVVLTDPSDKNYLHLIMPLRIQG